MTMTANVNTDADIETTPHIRETERSPRMTAKTLTLLLVAMLIVPAMVITAIFVFLPPVHENRLSAQVRVANVPPPEHYRIPIKERPEIKEIGQLLVTNTGTEDWTQYNIQINMAFADSYQVMEHLVPIRAGETKTFNLNDFVSRAGARFDLTYNPLRKVRIYARLPSKERATYFYNFETQSEDE